MITVVSKKFKWDFSSVQVPIGNKFAAKLKKWGYEHIPADCVYKPGSQYGRTTDMHITVKYGLHTTDAEQIKNKIKGFGQFEVTLGEITRFAKPDKDYDVVKLEVESDKLKELYKLLGELENSDEWPEFRPHITFAYIENGTCRELSGNTDFKNQKINVDRVVFSPKDGGNKRSINL